MDSAVHGADSSSASVNFRFVIRKTEWASTGILSVYPEEGPSFLVRAAYLSPECAYALEGVPVALTDSLAESLLSSARVFLAERAALAYLARAEHCRSLLSVKLSKKGYTRDESEPALAYLASCGYLDDARYAEAWLRSRVNRVGEGRRKLLAGLLTRGVSRDVAEQALRSLFAEADERDLCHKALNKLERLGKSDEQIRVSLIRKGFAMKTIEECREKR